MSVRGANGGGDEGNRRADLAAFDRLPAKAREALTQAPFNAKAQDVVNIAKRRGHRGDEVTLLVGDLLSDEARSQTRKTYGTDHPQSEAPRWIPERAKRLIKEPVRVTRAQAAIVSTRVPRGTRS